jgi:predicted dehydrogenase
MALRAVVIGTGWAGEGHTVALRAAGVDVVAICGRTPEPAKAMAAKLGIEDLRFDWRRALTELRPDIVALSTTAAPHREMAEFAAQLGCHLLCDKPLGINAMEAQAMLDAAEQAGVKHAYAFSSCYDPIHLYARQLLAEGLIGKVSEIESILNFYESPLAPYSWFHTLALGGGMLNNVLTHKLGQVSYITKCQVVAAAGEAMRLLDRAPVGETIHDFRQAFGKVVQPDVHTEWRTVDADLAYTVMLQLRMPDGGEASALFRSSALAECRNPGYTAFYGEKGTLHLSGPFAPNRIEHFDSAKGEWKELSVPAHITDTLPQVESHVQRDWNMLCREFVADVCGERVTDYPTFRAGLLHNQVFDIVRSGRGWTAIADPTHV